MKTTRQIRGRKNSRRAVSPIIATILLVAITVVLAAVLYILITGLTTSSSKPYSLGLGGPGSPAKNGLGTTFYDNFSISPTSGLTTSLFGLKIASPSNSPVASAAIVAACTSANGFAQCTAPASGWYAVLVSSTGAWLGAFPTAAGGTAWSGGTVNTASSDTIVIVSAAQISGSGDTLSCFGTGSSTVTGQVTM